MPILGYDLVVKCKLCDATARARVPQDHIGDPVDFMNIFSQLHREGFESDGGDDFLCWNHGRRRARAPKPAPSLQREKP